MNSRPSSDINQINALDITKQNEELKNDLDSSLTILGRMLKKDGMTNDEFRQKLTDSIQRKEYIKKCIEAEYFTDRDKIYVYVKLYSHQDTIFVIGRYDKNLSEISLFSNHELDILILRFQNEAKYFRDHALYGVAHPQSDSHPITCHPYIILIEPEILLGENITNLISDNLKSKIRHTDLIELHESFGRSVSDQKCIILYENLVKTYHTSISSSENNKMLLRMDK